MELHERGYGTPSVQALTELVAAAKLSDPLAPVTIVVRDDIAAITTRRNFAAGVGDLPGVAAITVTTIGRVAEHLVTLAGHTRLPVTVARLTAQWRAELESEPGSLAPVASHPATVRALIRAHRDLRGADETALDIVTSSGALGSDLVRLHQRVVERTLGVHVDDVTVLEEAARLAGSSRNTAALLGTVILFLPSELAQPERAFITALSVLMPLQAIIGLTGIGDIDAPVMQQFAEPVMPRSGTDNGAVAGRVIHASDADDEVRAIVREIVARLAEGIPAHRIAALYPKEAPYSRLLHDHLAAAGITTNGPGVRPLRDRAIADGFLTFLQLDPDDLPRVTFFDWLGRAPVRMADGGIVPRTAWERLSRESGVTGGDWTERLDAHLEHQRGRLDDARSDPDASDGKVRRLERAVSDTDGLRTFVSELVKTLRAGRNAHGWVALSEWALAAFDRYIGPAGRLPEAEQRAATAIHSTLRSLTELDGIGNEPGLSGLVEILDVELDQRRPREGRFGEGVFVGPIRAAASLSVTDLFVLGLSEDQYPGRLSADPLLPDSVRAQTAGAFETARDRLRTSHRDLLAAFASAKRVTASFPRGDLRRGSERLPSRWLMPTLRSLAGKADLEATRWFDASSPDLTSIDSHWRGVTQLDAPATEQEWRLRHHVGGGSVTDPAIDSAACLTEARRSNEFTRFDGNLAGVEGLPDFADGQRLVSPTQLERYAGCPHSYFIERVLGVSSLELPEEIITIRPSDIGNIMHEVMDKLALAYVDDLPGFGEPWSPEHRERMRDIAAHTMSEFERRGLTGHPRLWSRERSTLLANLEALLDADDRIRNDRDARVVASELSFGMNGAPPVYVEVEGGVVAMRGSADRVDERSDGTYIVTDFKSGSARSFADIDSDPVVGGKKLQLPLYAHAARAAYGANDVEAEYWFVGTRDRGTRVRVELNSEVEARYQFALGALVGGIRKGQFIARPPASDDFAWVVCAYCNPDGVGYGHVRGPSERKAADPALADLFALLDPTVNARTSADLEEV